MLKKHRHGMNFQMVDGEIVDHQLSIKKMVSFLTVKNSGQPMLLIKERAGDKLALKSKISLISLCHILVEN